MDDAREGVIIEGGAADWQVVQQRSDGSASIELRGSWSTGEPHRTARVIVRVVRENGLDAVTAALDWAPAEMERGGRWSATLPDVPAGGLYRIETALHLDESPIEWAVRGDMIHHLGVGDVWLIAGQSNAVGYGKTPVEDGPELGISMFAADGRWKLATHPLGDSTRTIYPANRERANASHSPWLAFARRLRSALGYPIGLIPTALGGSPASAWDPGADGALFRNMADYLRDSGSASGGSPVRGALWYQGESDVADEARAVYRRRFGGFVRELRRLTRNRSLPVITVQLNRYNGEGLDSAVHERWEAMRELQRRISREMANVMILPAFDSGLSDVIHNDSHGNLVIGERAASVALGAVYGRDVEWRFPECRSARATAPDRIALEFDNVTGRLNYESRVATDAAFAVRDRGGLVPIVGCELDGPATIVLALARPLQGSATVTGAPTANPPHAVPFCIPGFRPMMGFRMKVTAQS